MFQDYDLIEDETEEVDAAVFLTESLKRFTSYLQIEADALCADTKQNRLCNLHVETPGVRRRGRLIDERAQAFKARITELQQFLSTMGVAK